MFGQHKRAVGIFPRFEQMAEALDRLKVSGFPIEHISVIGKEGEHYSEQLDRAVKTEAVGDRADDGAKTGALAGGVLGVLTGFFVGIGALAIPGVGPVMLAGALATALATTVSGGVIGAAAGTLLGGLIGLGIPEERANIYYDRIQRGEFLMMIDGTEGEILHARSILIPLGIQEWDIYDAPTLDPVPANTSSRVVDRR